MLPHALLSSQPVALRVGVALSLLPANSLTKAWLRNGYCHSPPCARARARDKGRQCAIAGDCLGDACFCPCTSPRFPINHLAVTCRLSQTTEMSFMMRHGQKACGKTRFDFISAMDTSRPSDSPRRAPNFEIARRRRRSRLWVSSIDDDRPSTTGPRRRGPTRSRDSRGCSARSRSSRRGRLGRWECRCRHGC